MKIAIYIRVSTQEQAREGYSLEAQEKILRDYCQIKKHQIVNVYSDEGISGGSIEKRLAFQKMIRDAKNKQFDAILVWKLTRFSRNLSDLIQTCEELEKNGVYLISFSESFDSTTPAGRMIRSMLGTVAQFEREVTAENVKLALENRASSGARTCSEILGYDLQGKTSLQINEKEAVYIRFVFDNYLIYKNLSEVAALCREKGFTGKRGRKASAQSILVILTCPVYAGYNRYCGQVYKGSHEPIISVKQYNKVQSILKQQGKLNGRKRLKNLTYLPDK